MRRRWPTGSTPGNTASASARLTTTTGCGGGGVGALERPSAQHRCAHGAEIVGRRRDEVGAVLAWRQLPAGDLEPGAALRRDCRHAGRRAGRLDAGELRKPIHQCRCRACPRAGLGSFAIARLNDSTWSGTNPGSRAVSATKLRTSSPAPATTITASATSAMAIARAQPPAAHAAGDAALLERRHPRRRAARQGRARTSRS